MPSTSSYIRWFNPIGLRDVALVGGKNASLGEFYRKLSGTGVRVPRFAEYFDDFSIGSNDLTQLTLGVDRDSENRLVVAAEKERTSQEALWPA